MENAIQQQTEVTLQNIHEELNRIPDPGG